MFSASKSGKVVYAVTPDPQFNYVTALLHGDGTNGAQNNTFLDSSSNAFTVTRNGTPTQGSFSPYGSLWSNYFNGTTDYLITNNTTNLGSGNFTIEGWFYFNSFGSNQVLIDVYNGSTTNSWQIYTNTGAHFFWYSAATGITQIVGTATLSINTWYHFAAVRSSTTVKTYVNGVLDGTTTDATNYNATGALWIGGQRVSGPTDFFNGYASNVRIVVGTAVYTSTFTPPTSPLTAITGTQLLTCQANRFIDNSGNAYAITPSGTPSIQRFNPFLPTSSQAYSTSVYGGSGYFNGSTDYVSTSSTVTLSGNYTAEAWVMQTSASQNSIGFSIGSDIGLTTSIFAYIGTTQIPTMYVNANSYGGANAIPLNQWCHLAIVRNGTTVSLYVNGVSVTSVTSAAIVTGSIFLGTITLTATRYYQKGYISDVRITNAALYTSTFTPPSAPLTTTVGSGTVQFLENFINGAIYDNAMMNDWITVGSAQISTSVKKYGTGSLSFNGSTDQLTSNAPNTNLYAFGTNDFTIEMWFYVAGGATANTNLYDSTPSGGGVVALQIYIIGSPWTIRLYGGSAGALLDSNYTVSTSIWYHLAICRASGSTKIFVNGTQQGSTYSDSNNYTNGSQRPVIGAWGTGSGNYFNGYIDDLRVTKGYARYTSTFTPPTTALPNYGS